METKTCPFCGEEIKAAAIKCRFCSELLADTTDLPLSLYRYEKSQANDFLLNMIRRFESDTIGEGFDLDFSIEIDMKSIRVENLLNVISIEAIKRIKERECIVDWQDRLEKLLDSGYQRTLKNLNKIAKNVKIESEHILASLFLNVRVVRNDLTTEIVDGNEFKDFSIDPYDLDYEITPDTIKQILQETWVVSRSKKFKWDNIDSDYHKTTQRWRKIWEKKKPKRLVCSVRTYDICPDCNGEGFFRCEKCSGRGKYTHQIGYFASGQERFNTVAEQCENCEGEGKIECKKCMGTGKHKYQVIKKVTDKKIVQSYALIVTPWVESSSCGEWRGNEKSGQYLEYPDYEISWLEFDDKELSSGIDKLYKNRTELLANNNVIQSKIEKEFRHLYEQNREASLEFFEKDQQGELACSIEKHLLIPFFRVSMNFQGDDSKYYIYIIQFPDSIECYLSLNSLPKLGFFKSFSL